VTTPGGVSAQLSAPVVLVVGMHRSGTSAVASALASLGLALPPPEDLLGRRRGNEHGHFESQSLLDECDEVLRRLGGAWDDPPAASSDPTFSEELAPLVKRARSAFGATFADRRSAACWKDPRTALLLPFWRQAIDRPLAAVLCVRHPLEVAQSLEHRDAIALPAGLALWERYMRSALSGLAGLPVFVSEYADALAQPAEWRRQAAEWLATLGVAGNDTHAAGAEQALNPALRHFQTDSRTDAVASGQLQLYEELRALRGPHESFAYEPASDESPWTAYVLQTRGDVLRIWRGMEWLGDELAGQLLSLPSPEPELPAGVAHYCMNATEDEDRYHSWLIARGEPLCLPPDTPATLVARGRTLPRNGDLLGRSRGESGRWRRRLWPAHPPPSRPRDEAASPSRPERPLFSVIVSYHRPAPARLDRCIASVIAQSHSDWEMCLCGDNSSDPAIGEHVADIATDDRFRTTTPPSAGGVAAALNAALRLATGRYVVFLDVDDELHPTALARIAQTIDERPETDVVYSDEDRIDEHGWRLMPIFKPAWSPDLLLSNPYLGHAFVVRRDLVCEIGGFRSEFDGAEGYDLMLRIAEVTAAIVHIPEVLYHHRLATRAPANPPDGEDGSTSDAGRRVLEDTARRRGADASVVPHPRVEGSYHFIRHPSSRALVSAIIPFRDEPALTAACYRAFIEHPGYDNFELLLVDNDSALPETHALLEDLSRDHRVRPVTSPGPFDWVEINNGAVRKARGDLLLFLNNDVMPRSENWLAHMVAQAQRPDVGAVGARLLYPDGTIQHAGVVVGVGAGSTHVQQGISADRPGYMSLTTVTRNVSAVTGACLMTSRSAFETVGGFDEKLPIAFNDIDYCLKLRDLGLLVVYTPLAEMIHHESKSRGHSEDLKEAPYFRKRWRTVMLAGDPYYNRNLSRFDNSCRLPVEGDEERWETFLSMLGDSSTS
jgi:GT2 family glycosyltransferase